MEMLVRGTLYRILEVRKTKNNYRVEVRMVGKRHMTRFAINNLLDILGPQLPMIEIRLTLSSHVMFHVSTLEQVLHAQLPSCVDRPAEATHLCKISSAQK